MRSVHYFPRYSQRENVVTNNALLLLVRLHEFSRFKFENLIEKMCEDAELEFAPQWLRFNQQVGTGTSVVDGFIGQDSVKIAVETKLYETFSADQLHRHLDLFTDEKHRLLILLSPSLDQQAELQLISSRKIAKERRVDVLHTTFENLIKLFREQLSHHDEGMLALIEDFESFCSENKLLPKDEYTLFVPPCGQSYRENEEFRLYYCPADRNLRKAKYLGIYAGKRVRAIGQIAKVVVCTIDLQLRTVSVVDSDTTLTSEEKARIIGATEKAPNHDWDIASGHRFYLCDDWAATEFNKTTRGGIMGHRYFDLRQELDGVVPKEIEKVADALTGCTWV